MDGEFLRRKFNVGLFLLLICGLLFIGRYIFLHRAGPDENGTLLAFLIMGIIMCLVAIFLWLWNFGAFIHIDEEAIKAKYNWFGKIDCNLSDVSFAAAQGNALTIMLKSGKIHSIFGAANAWQLATAIRRKTSFDVSERPDTLIEKLNELKKNRKKGIILTFSGTALLFINIFITVFLTGERDMVDFSKNDWIVFIVMGVIEMAIVIATFYFAQKTGKKVFPIEKMKYAVQRRTIETEPLLPGSAVGIFADEDYTKRVTVFGYPNDDSVYYIVEEISSEYSLIKAYESEIFEDIEHLPDGLESWIDITKEFLPKFT